MSNIRFTFSRNTVYIIPFKTFSPLNTVSLIVLEYESEKRCLECENNRRISR